ncbi:MAG: MBL fold metallo-hydrolase [Nitrospirales bacterium]|nr:MBL fold metallo-hydrolase [Nitrospirales bacterium]
MKVIRLKKNPSVYTSYSYLVLGSWNRIDDVNTIIDPGIDGYIISEIQRLPTGLGKVPVEQIILTHGHFDHSGGAKAVKLRFGSKIIAHHSVEECDIRLNDGQTVKMGDQYFEAICTPGHSSDSICLYCAAEGVLFSGDTPLRIMTSGGTYTEAFLYSLQRIGAFRINIVYPGHDDPLAKNVKEVIARSLKNVLNSTIVP